MEIPLAATVKVTAAIIIITTQKAAGAQDPDLQRKESQNWCGE